MNKIATAETIALRKTEWFKTMDAEMTPAKVLRTIRETMNLSMAQLGEKVGVTAQRICDFETGRRGISKAIAKKLSGLTGLSVGSFI
jgi:transcriptional regulator with XRE-family HTH domain